MVITRYIETIASNLESIAITPGQFIYCSDTCDFYHDTLDSIRNRVSDFIYVSTEAQRLAIMAPITEKLYFVHETNTMYIHYGEDWITIGSASFSPTDTTQFGSLIGGVLTVNGAKCAPKTKSALVYNSDGSTVEDKLGTITKLGLSTATTAATEDLQKIFSIPFPFENYISLGNAMLIHIGGMYIDPNRYTITNNYLVLNSNETGVELGRSVLYTFIYNSGNVVTSQLLNGSYIVDGSLELSKTSSTFFNNVKLSRLGIYSAVPTNGATSVTFSIDGFDKTKHKLDIYMDRGKLFEGIDYTLGDNAITLIGITSNGSNKFVFEAFNIVKV